jgi:hypothetical protein
MVDVVITGVSGRVQMADALRRFAGLPPAWREGDVGFRPSQVVAPHEIASDAVILGKLATTEGAYSDYHPSIVPR